VPGTFDVIVWFKTSRTGRKMALIPLCASIPVAAFVCAPLAAASIGRISELRSSRETLITVEEGNNNDDELAVAMPLTMETSGSLGTLYWISS